MGCYIEFRVEHLPIYPKHHNIKSSSNKMVVENDDYWCETQEHHYSLTMTEETENDEDFRWSTSTINLLVDLRLAREGEFERPKTKKKKMWQSIADEINKKCNCNVSSDLCDSKFRNMMNTYRSIKKKQLSGGDVVISWKYFDKFDQVLGSKAIRYPLPSFISDTMQSSLKSEMAEETVETEPYTSTVYEPSNPSGRGSSRKRNQFLLSEYLYKKLKTDEEISLKKIRLKEKIWEETKLLKRKEILAIMELAKALKK